jgi:hypothetical protein
MDDKFVSGWWSVLVGERRKIKIRRMGGYGF